MHTTIKWNKHNKYSFSGAFSVKSNNYRVSDSMQILQMKKNRVQQTANIVGYLPQEEWQPAQYENAHDDSQRTGGFVFALHFDKLFVFCRRMLMVQFVEC